MKATETGPIWPRGAISETHVVAIDIGGTHARFAIAELREGRVASLSQETVLKTADFSGIREAWQAYGQSIERPLPSAAAIAVAARVDGGEVRFTNNHWIVRPDTLNRELKLTSHFILNDFAAVAHAVAQLGQEDFEHVCGPAMPLPDRGTIAVVGPGTGLGAAMVLRKPDGYTIHATEGGHIGFAPTSEWEDALLARLRGQHGRVSVERVVSGPGLAEFYASLRAEEGDGENVVSDAKLWALALSGNDETASDALERFLGVFGAVSGDLVLAQGADAMVIAGGLGYRMRAKVARSGFADRFVEKGRFASMMANIPVKLILHSQPGLFGAAAAYARSRQQ